MYKVTLILFAFFSLVFPILAVSIRVPNEIDELAQRATNGSGLPFTGKGTKYIPGVGACGKTNFADQLVVRISTNVWRVSPEGIHCSQAVNISFGDKSVVATTVDKCRNCGDEDLGACQNFGTWNSIHPLDFLVN